MVSQSPLSLSAADSFFFFFPFIFSTLSPISVTISCLTFRSGRLRKEEMIMEMTKSETRWDSTEKKTRRRLAGDSTIEASISCLANTLLLSLNYLIFDLFLHIHAKN
ncbi:hypothetical protein Bca52824_026813 [Brassica carinata]|uniref:Uncharacterized protein n=1 Tax=Brassica carinata TaxID=52824 RepID=A0A8X7V8A1_BRACI|nr:hypothetical protein Bca52824_026813 [Brassica carinata]